MSDQILQTDDAAKMLLSLRENICPSCVIKQEPPELIELVECKCMNSKGKLLIDGARAILDS